ncbi:MAG: segregation/condensation protein A [Cyanobacteriota bacterium]|nr:segregation/condensation protein A [Cyanobacteriota bacterium]
MPESGARLAIRLLQEAALRGEIDPWDVDVIAVIDGFLDQLRQRMALPRLRLGGGGSYEQDLAESSEAFLAASVLVGLKAELLETSTFPPVPELEAAFDFAGDDLEQELPGMVLPRRPERHLLRRPVAPPPLQRPVTLGDLIRQLEEIAEQLEHDDGGRRQRQRGRRLSDRAAIAQVATLAHRETLPETTAALAGFLQRWPAAMDGRWIGFEQLVTDWAASVQEEGTGDDLDQDRVGVFWALLFLCSQGKVELEQGDGLFSPLSLRPLEAGSAGRPAPERMAA